MPLVIGIDSHPLRLVHVTPPSHEPGHWIGQIQPGTPDQHQLTTRMECPYCHVMLFQVPTPYNVPRPARVAMSSSVPSDRPGFKTAFIEVLPESHGLLVCNDCEAFFTLPVGGVEWTK